MALLALWGIQHYVQRSDIQVNLTHLNTEAPFCQKLTSTFRAQFFMHIYSSLYSAATMLQHDSYKFTLCIYFNAGC